MKSPELFDRRIEKLEAKRARFLRSIQKIQEKRRLIKLEIKNLQDRKRAAKASNYLELRRRIVDYILSGHTQKEACEVFRVGLSYVGHELRWFCFQQNEGLARRLLYFKPEDTHAISATEALKKHPKEFGLEGSD